MKTLFFITFAVYAVSVVLEFTGTAFRKDKLLKSAWLVFLAAFALHTVFIIAMKTEWLKVAAMPVALLIMTYAALQPMEIKDLMPALRSAWFGVHIGSAVLSYAAFVIAGCIGARYLMLAKKEQPDKKALEQMDFLSYRLVSFGFLFLTVVILSGAIWAEQAWSAFWTWDPKEVWALITWIIYAVYLHLRLRGGRKGTRMAWFLVIAVFVVFFTFAGVNTLLHGLHTYG